jgi:hypothetical protein
VFKVLFTVAMPVPYRTWRIEMALPSPRAIESHDQLSTADAWAAEIVSEAHLRTVRASTAEMAAFLQDLVGQQLTAVMTDVADPKAVGKWARGERVPRGDASRRLRDAYHAAILLTLGESAQTARAWLMGMNPLLDDRAPAAVIAASPDGAVRAMQAARAFLAHG